MSHGSIIYYKCYVCIPGERSLKSEEKKTPPVTIRPRVRFRRSAHSRRTSDFFFVRFELRPPVYGGTVDFAFVCSDPSPRQTRLRRSNIILRGPRTTGARSPRTERRPTRSRNVAAFDTITRNSALLHDLYGGPKSHYVSLQSLTNL